MARYLIAGAAGYTGSRLAMSLLRQGHYVRGLARDPDIEIVQRLASQGMAVWEGDITQPDTLIGAANGIEYVYNLTARLVLENGHVRRTFVDGNRNLIAACSRARTVQAYLFASNVAPYGDRGDEWLYEKSPVAPCYPLGNVMVEAEQVVMDLVRKHHFPAILLRIGTIYGPDRDVVDAALHGVSTLIGNGQNFVSRIHTDDLVHILQRLALDGQPGALYNIGDDEPIRLGEFYTDLYQRLGLAPPRLTSRENALAFGIDQSVVGMSSASVRLRNQRLRDELSLTLRYPSIRTWLDERIGALEPSTHFAP